METGKDWQYYVHSFTQQRFIECLLNTRHYSIDKNPCFQRAKVVNDDKNSIPCISDGEQKSIANAEHLPILWQVLSETPNLHVFHFPRNPWYYFLPFNVFHISPSSLTFIFQVFFYYCDQIQFCLDINSVQGNIISCRSWVLTH